MGHAVYVHTHWDREWYASHRTYQVRLVQAMAGWLNQLESGALPCFMLDGQTTPLSDYLALCPQDEPRFRALIQQQKLAIGPWWVMPDTLLVAGECLLRNLRFGIAYSRNMGSQKMGPCEQGFTGYLPDTFGHSADLPMLFSFLGINTAIVWRGVTTISGQHWYRWQGHTQSSASLTTFHLQQGYFQWPFHDPQLKTPQERVTAFQNLYTTLTQAHTSKSQPVLIPLGGDHLGPMSAENLTLLRQTVSDTHLTFSTPHAWLQENCPEHLNTLAGELRACGGSDTPFLLPGVASSRVYLKQWQRRLEHQLLWQCEPLWALTQQAYTQQGHQIELSETLLDTAWRLLVENTAHDSIGGCSIDTVHQQNVVHYTEVYDLSQACMRYLESIWQQHTPQQMAILLNTGQRPHQGIIPVTWHGEAASPAQVMQQQQILDPQWQHRLDTVPLSHCTTTAYEGWVYCAEALAPLSAQTITLENLKNALPPSEAQVHVSNTLLENQWFQVLLCPEKRGVLVRCKRSGRQYGPLHQWSDQAQQGDSYNAAPVPHTTQQHYRIASQEVLQSGPLVGSWRLRFEHDGLDTIETTVSLWADSAQASQVRFSSRWVNTRPDHQLTIGFDTQTPIAAVWAEGAFLPVLRPYDPHYDVTTHMPAPPQCELPMNTGPFNRYVMANQQLLLSQGLCEYSVSGTVLGLTALRAFGKISSPDTGVRGTMAGPPWETPEGQCLNRLCTAEIAFSPIFNPIEADGLSLHHAILDKIESFYGCQQALLGQADASSLNASAYQLPIPPEAAGHVLTAVTTQAIRWMDTTTLTLQEKML